MQVWLTSRLACSSDTEFEKRNSRGEKPFFSPWVIVPLFLTKSKSYWFTQIPAIVLFDCFFKQPFLKFNRLNNIRKSIVNRYVTALNKHYRSLSKFEKAKDRKHQILPLFERLGAEHCMTVDLAIVHTSECWTKKLKTLSWPLNNWRYERGGEFDPLLATYSRMPAGDGSQFSLNQHRWG